MGCKGLNDQILPTIDYRFCLKTCQQDDVCFPQESGAAPTRYSGKAAPDGAYIYKATYTLLSRAAATCSVMFSGNAALQVVIKLSETNPTKCSLYSCWKRGPLAINKSALCRGTGEIGVPHILQSKSSNDQCTPSPTLAYVNALTAHARCWILCGYYVMTCSLRKLVEYRNIIGIFIHCQFPISL